MSPQLLRRLYRIGRALPIPKTGSRKDGHTFWALRFDDVRQVLSEPEMFREPYKARLQAILGSDTEFLLGMGPGDAYNDQNRRLRAAIYDDDISKRLPEAAEQAVAALLPDTDRVDIVPVLRRATARVLLDYFGLGDKLSDTALAKIEAQAERLFEFQFANPAGDPELRRAVRSDGAALRALVDARIRAPGPPDPDTLIGRYSAANDPEFNVAPETLRAAMISFVVGGLPQPLMVASNALDELFRRPEALQSACNAANDNEDEHLGRIVFEAMRLAPLAPALARVATKEAILAPGTWRSRMVRKGDKIMAVFAAGMTDPRRIEKPESFDPDRNQSYAMHFGFGHHACFAAGINRRMVPALLKPILKFKPRRVSPLRRRALVFPSSLDIRL